MANILMAWELGGGFGHVRRLADIGRNLLARGHSVRFAVVDPKGFQSAGFEKLQVQTIPQWPGIMNSKTKSVVAATFGDLLAELIFRDEAEIVERIAMWSKVFADSKADILVADYAPGAVLAARGRLPVVNIGDSYYLPPHELAEFPSLFKTRARYPEPETMERINRALSKSGLSLLSALPDAGRADVTVVTNFPVLDIYASTRSIAAIGPLAVMPNINQSEGNSLFGYFSQGTEFNSRIINGLLASKRGGKVVIPNMRANPVPDPFAVQLKFTGQLADLRQAFEGAAVFVSHGGAQTMAAAVCAGVPQVVVAVDDEKRLLGRSIAEAGAGISLLAETLQSSDLASAINQVAQQSQFRRAALTLAKSCQAIMAQHPMNRMLAIIDQLL